MLLLCLLYVTNRVFSDQIIPLLSKRYLPLVSVHETYNKELTSKTYLSNKRTISTTKKVIFPVKKSNLKCTTKLGEPDQGNLSAEGSSVSVKIKPLFWICSCSLPIQTPDSLSMHVTSRALWHTTTPSPSPKILMIIITITHTHIHTIILSKSTFSLKKFEPVDAKEQSQGAELHVMWNYKELR